MTTVRTGLEVLLDERIDLIAGRRTGLITNHAAVNRRLQSAVDLLAAHPDVRLTALFAPEHGLRGDVQAGEEVATVTDERTGLPVYSLYGPTRATRKPTPDMLKDVDVLVYDLPDGGVRYFTYLSTMGYAMEAAAEQGIPFVVLDRPNPIGGTAVEGNIVEDEFRSFVGAYPIPIRHGLTIGELATLINTEYGVGAELVVVPLDGWHRDMYFRDTALPWAQPSPNIPTPETLVVYPGTCLFEGTNLSEGRGTTRPFEWLGAPWIDAYAWADTLNALQLPGVMFRPVYFVPTFSKHEGTLCRGVEVHVTDPHLFRPVETGLHLLITARAQNEDAFKWVPPMGEVGEWFIDLLTGTSIVRRDIDAGDTIFNITSPWRQPLTDWLEIRSKYIVYG